ncbi:MAG: ROK family transcriptional regulator [Alphaproteobacteria bacterium]
MLLNGSNIEQTRSYNRRVVLEAVRRTGPISRAEIARATYLSPQTVSNIARELENLGLLRDDGRRPSKRGQPPKDLTINPEGGYTVGLQLDRGHLIGVLVNLTGNLLQRCDFVVADPAPENALPLMAAAVDELIGAAELARDRIFGVGVVMPGPFDVDGLTSVGPTTLPGWSGMDVGAALGERVHLPVLVENDAMAAAIGERFYGAARDLQHFFYLFIGTGLGSGMILAGQPYKGAWGNAGEIGHMIVMPDGKACPCGNRGCLEQYVSLHAVSQAMRAVGKVAESPADIRRLFDAGDPDLQEWIDSAAIQLRTAITNIENLFDPQSILLGGYLPDEVLSALLARLEPLNTSVSNRRNRRHPRLIRATAGTAATALGAAVLPLIEMMSPSLQVLLKDGHTQNHPATGSSLA